MTELFQSGRVADLILMILLLEGLGLWCFHRRTGRGLPLEAVLPFLLAGAQALVTQL